ncbi:MAG: isoleucine--tRNA ligase [Candidatus Paracaedibacteraceae bacterium]|nr:isoleucine--tRNA ligase [Candidatus Paracaedibacteraceae bacterium]
MDYKASVFLPKTTFAMKANLSVREPEILAQWESDHLFQFLRTQSKGRPKFVMAFGPPYANGNIHIGHALSEVLKDIINKTYQMNGFDAGMIPGWDCHGLPIEWKIEEQYRAKGKNKDEVDPLVFRAECRTFAANWTAIQKEEFKRLGIIADFDNAYSTMAFETEAKIVAELGKFLMNGSLYRGLRPVMWSVVEKTALADAEVEYKDHTSDSIYVAFNIVKSTIAALNNVAAVIWTTTPWTLPGNRAIAYGEEIEYVVIKAKQATDLITSDRQFLVAKDLASAFCTAVGLEDFEITFKCLGADLAGIICAHPWRDHKDALKGYDFDVPFLTGDHVTVDAGTGLVHTAPGHGVEDFEVGKKFGIAVPETVQGDGTYYEHVPLFAGQHIFKINPVVIQALTDVNALLKTSKLTHSYPHSWRSKAPLIYRATAQWFVSMQTNDLRKKALEAIDVVEWFPASGKNRIKSMVESRPDWCLSRQRAWGTPMTIFVNKRSGEPLRDPAVHQRIVDAIAAEGADVWFKNDAAYFLGDAYDANDYEKINDILDVWFDSGCTHSFVLRDNPDQQWPADVYLEGSDQHRGWFQSSLLQSCGTAGVAPYKKVVTHGFVLDERGYKMSKSIGNIVAPAEVIQKYGADMLRLWIVNSDYTEDLRIGNEILKHQEDIYRRFRNTLRYLLGALSGFSEAETIDAKSMPALEQWVLHRLKEIETAHQAAIESFDFSAFYMDLHHLCAVDLSAFYFDIRKDSLYCDGADSLSRRATRTVMNQILLCLTHWLAPVLSFTAEEAYQEYQTQTGVTDKTSIHASQFPKLDANWHQPALATRWEAIRDIRRVITSALELERAAKTIGSSLQGSVALYISAEKATYLQGLDLAELCITSSAKILLAQAPAGAVTLDDVPGVGVVVNVAEGGKCQRCWRILPEVGAADSIREHNDICIRCEDVVVGLNR